MNWLDILKDDQVEVLEQSEAEAQQYWDNHIGLAIGIDKTFKDNVKRDTNISRSGLVDEYKVYTWVDAETKIPLMSRTVGFGHDRFEGKQVVYFAGSTGLTYQLKKWNRSTSDKCWTNEGWEECDYKGEEEVQGEPRQGQSKEEAKKRGNWFKRNIRTPFRGKTASDVFEDEGMGKPKEGMDEARLESARIAGYYVNPNRMDLFTIADKHAGWDLKGSSTDSLNRVSPLYRRTQNYLLDKYKGNWIVTVLINQQLREYFQTSKGGNFRQAHFFTRSRSKHLVPPNIRELIRKVLGMKSAPWYIHTPTNIDTSMAGHDFGMDSITEGRGDDFSDNDFDSHGRYKGKTGHQKQKDIDDAWKAETVQPDDEDDETPGANFRLMPTIRETGALRDSEIVNVKDEDHCCSTIRNRIKERMQTRNVGHNNKPLVYKGKNGNWTVRRVEARYLNESEKNYLIQLFMVVDTGTCDQLLSILEGHHSPQDWSHPESWSRLKRRIKRHTRGYVNQGNQEIDIDQLLKDWEECSSMVQDKFEPHDTEFTASTKVDRWFGVIKDDGAVTFTGHGKGKQADLFNVEYGNDCGCGMEECECQKKK